MFVDDPVDLKGEILPRLHGGVPRPEKRRPSPADLLLFGRHHAVLRPARIAVQIVIGEHGDTLPRPLLQPRVDTGVRDIRPSRILPGSSDADLQLLLQFFPPKTGGVLRAHPILIHAPLIRRNAVADRHHVEVHFMKFGDHVCGRLWTTICLRPVEAAAPRQLLSAVCAVAPLIVEDERIAGDVALAQKCRRLHQKRLTALSAQVLRLIVAVALLRQHRLRADEFVQQRVPLLIRFRPDKIGIEQRVLFQENVVPTRFAAVKPMRIAGTTALLFPEACGVEQNTVIFEHAVAGRNLRIQPSALQGLDHKSPRILADVDDELFRADGNHRAVRPPVRTIFHRLPRRSPADSKGNFVFFRELLPRQRRNAHAEHLRRKQIQTNVFRDRNCRTILHFCLPSFFVFLSHCDGTPIVCGRVIRRKRRSRSL